jgi:hypothetical protein
VADDLSYMPSYGGSYFPPHSGSARRFCGFWGGVLIALWVGTQWMAYQWEYPPALGVGWMRVGWFTLYAPWQSVGWAWHCVRAGGYDGLLLSTLKVAGGTLGMLRNY